MTSFENKNRYSSRASNFHFSTNTNDENSIIGNNNKNNGIIIIHHGNFIGGDEDTIRKIFRTSYKVLQKGKQRSMFLNNISEGKYTMTTTTTTDANTDPDTDVVDAAAIRTAGWHLIAYRQSSHLVYIIFYLILIINAVKTITTAATKNATRMNSDRSR